MYSKEFRKGFDAASVISAIQECIRTIKEKNAPCSMYVKIHKDSIPLCQGLCAENMVNSEVRDELPINLGVIIEKGELWLILRPIMDHWN